MPPKRKGRKRQVLEGVGGGSNARFSEEEDETILERDAHARANGIDEPWKGQAKKLFPNRKDILKGGEQKADRIVKERAKALRRRERSRAKAVAAYDALAVKHGHANAVDAVRDARRRHAPARTHLMTSRFRGVHRHADSGKWRSQITKNGTTYNLGAFDDEEEASRAYEAAAGADEAAIPTAGTDRRQAKVRRVAAYLAEEAAWEAADAEAARACEVAEVA